MPGVSFYLTRIGRVPGDPLSLPTPLHFLPHHSLATVQACYIHSDSIQRRGLDYKEYNYRLFRFGQIKRENKDPQTLR